MPTVTSLMPDIKSLSNMERQELWSFLGELIAFDNLSGELPADCRLSRFSGGKRCLFCSSENIVMYGKIKNKQRFICKDCGRTFNDYSLSPLSNTKLSAEKWTKYAQCMLSGFSIRK